MFDTIPPSLTTVLDNGLEWVYSLQGFFEPTVILVPNILRQGVQSLSDTIGFDVPTLNMTLALFLTYPLAFIMNLLPFGPIRHYFNFLFGAFLIQFVVGVQWIHHLVTSLVVYGMFLVLPRRLNRYLVPLFVMLYCVLGHLHRQYINYLGWDLDFTSFQMVITQKLYMMAYNLYDAEVLKHDPENRAAKKCAKYALPELPNILEFLGYTFSFSCVLSGPAFEFTIYRQACHGSHMYDHTNNGNAIDSKPFGKIPSRFLPTLLPFLKSVAAMVAFVVIGNAFPILDTKDPQNNTPVILTQAFLSNPWPYRYAYTWIGLLGTRMKYFVAWLSSEGANNLWYQGFDGFDQNGNALGWTNANNLNLLGYEAGPSISSLSKEWNKKTSVWLARYVYIRTNGSLLAVYGTSAFWHGFYPGYYMFFLSVPLLTFVERLMKKKISPYFQNLPKIYHILCVITTSFFVEYLVLPFVLLARDRSYEAWKSHYFFGHIIPILFLLLGNFLPKPPSSNKDETKKQQ